MPWQQTLIYRSCICHGQGADLLGIKEKADHSCIDNWSWVYNVQWRSKKSHLYGTILEGVGGILSRKHNSAKKNSSAQKLATNFMFYARKEHIDIRHHIVRETIESVTITIKFLASEDMPVDILTKGLSRGRHQRSMELLRLTTINILSENGIVLKLPRNLLIH